MKNQLLLIALLLTLSTSAQNYVDSLYWNTSVSPHTMYVSLNLDMAHQIKHIDQQLNGDTLIIDMVFSNCSAPTAIYPWDSLITIPSSAQNPQYNFYLRYALDSNTITNNGCHIHPRWYDTIFTYFIPVGVNEYERYNLRAVRSIPNPVVSKLRLDGLNATGMMVGIYSCTGQLVSRKLYEQFIDVSQLVPGLYFFRVENAAGFKPGWFRKE